MKHHFPTLGFDKNNVVLAEHDSRWSVAYVTEAARLAGLLGDEVISIDHFGSTAVAGIKAKPVIDILIQTESGKATEELSQVFAKAGYEMKSFPDREEKLFFLEQDGLRFYNAHVAKAGGEFARKMIEFRDTLRSNFNLAKEYESIKLREAENNPNDSQAYYNAKRFFFKKAIGWDY